MRTDSTRYAGWRERHLVRRRRNELERLLATSRHTAVAWGQELAHIERTGRLDWVNPNPIRVHPASDRLMPPPPRPVVDHVFRPISRG